MKKHMKAYFKLSKHYGWALKNVFTKYPSLEYLIIIEDDMEFARDFLEYHLSMAQVLLNDSSLYCVSAWNDNGKQHLVGNSSQAASRLYRTDFFPGLGWSLKRSVWNELSSKWPDIFWDDWMRDSEQMKGRQCISPEIPRISTFGNIGVSNGQFFYDHLAHIHEYRGHENFYNKLNSLGRQLNGNDYKRTFLNKVYNESKEMHRFAVQNLEPFDNKQNRNESSPSYRITYYTRNDLKVVTKMFGLMSDLKNGIPRTAYHGVVTFHYKGHLVYIAPPKSWKDYIKSWN